MSEASATDYELAVERVVGFAQEFDRTHLDLACHAAFPLVLTPDLLYQIWLRFVPQAPWTAVARVLLSRLCHEVGYELYEMDVAVRNLLLRELKEDERFGQKQLEKLADFLTNYVRPQLDGKDSNARDLAQAQSWTALAYTKPNQLSSALAKAIESRLKEKNWKELFRLASLVETFAEPLAEFSPPLITYARGMESFTRGDVEGATEQFSKLPRRDRLVDIEGVSLSIPEKVPLIRVALYFLLSLLQLISNSNENLEKVYSTLQDNLDKLDASFADLLREYAGNFVGIEEPDKARAIAENITTLSNILLQFPLGSRANNLEIAISGYEIALEVRTREAFPQDWAEIQNNLGIAYRNRITGERANNIEAAISAFQAALEVYTRETFPQQWASIQNNLGNAYRDRIRGKKAENIEAAISAYQAALEVYTREAFPQQWASIQNNLGNAYSDRIRGKKAENIEAAISAYQAALLVSTHEAFPQDWAETQNNIGLAYKDRIRGEKEANIEAAISAFQAALEVYTREAFSQDWAAVQNNLGTAYGNRIRGGKAENLETAIACFLAALEVYTRKAFPQNYLETLLYLWLAYQSNQQFYDAYHTLANAIETLESVQGAILPSFSKNIYQSMVKSCLKLGYTDKAVEYVERSKARSLVRLLTNYNLYPKGNIPNSVLNDLQRLRLEISMEQLRIETKNKPGKR